MGMAVVVVEVSDSVDVNTGDLVVVVISKSDISTVGEVLASTKLESVVESA